MADGDGPDLAWQGGFLRTSTPPTLCSGESSLRVRMSIHPDDTRSPTLNRRTESVRPCKHSP